METKSEMLRFRVTPQVKQEIIERMEHFSINNMTEYLTKMALYGEVQKLEFDLSAINDMCYELNRIGNNLNQIAKICNKTKNVDVNNVIKIQQELSLKLDKNYSQVGKLMINLNKKMRLLNGNY